LGDQNVVRSRVQRIYSTNAGLSLSSTLAAAVAAAVADDADESLKTTGDATVDVSTGRAAGNKTDLVLGKSDTSHQIHGVEQQL
jgi:hypothetical protein